ncbi:MAG: hypothetical protein M1839_009375 [Geoglossum umbratile]|nr:MAG: hypothetical protein M1839_009375 [Geoglossum umbratile]
MSSLPNLAPTSSAADIREHLKLITNNSDGSILLYDHPVAFKNSEHRNNWKQWVHNAEDFHLYSEFQQAPLKGATIRLGLFTTAVSSWVVLLIGQAGKKGKEMVIWDSDAAERVEKNGPVYNSVTLGSMRTLYTYLTNKAGMNIMRVWIGGDGNGGQTECLTLSIDFIEKVMKDGGLGHDLEDEGFTIIKGKK